MISQGRSPILEKLLSNGNYPDTTAETNCDPNAEVTNDTSEFLYQFPEMNVETSYSNRISNQTFVHETLSTRSQVVPYKIDLAKDNLIQASDIWSQSSIGQNDVHHFNPSVLCCTDDADIHPLPSLPAETNVAGVPNFLLRVEEPSPFTMVPQQVLTDVHSAIDTNSLIENNATWETPSDTRQPFYNPTSNRLRHFTLPFDHISYQQDNVYPDFSSNLTTQFYHDAVPYSNQTERNNAISTPYLGYNSTLMDSTGCYSEPHEMAPHQIPHQSLPNFYQFNFVQQSFVNQYLIENPANSQMYNEVQHASQYQTSNYLYARNDSNLRQLSDVCVNTSTRKPPSNILNSGTISRNDQISENSTTYTSISGTKPLSHQPLITIKEPRAKSSCIYEKDNVTVVPKFHEKSEVVQTTKTEEQPLCLVKEASRTEQVKAQVDEFVKSPNKQRRKWSCPVCGRTLTRASTLKIHLRQHSGDRPFKCPSCPKSFAQPSLLNSHSRMHSGERPYSCSVCHKTFAHLSALKTHTRTHTGERPHQCPVPNCGMAFTDTSTLSKHARVHSGERPYLCGICSRRFTQSGNLNKHKRSVHKAVTSGLTKVKIPESTKILSEILSHDENTTSAITKV